MSRQTREIPAAARGQLRRDEGFDGRNTATDGAIVKQVIVALPVVDAALSVIVFGEVKFKSGGPNVHVGTSTAPVGAPLSE
jgi:hypothetical protein